MLFPDPFGPAITIREGDSGGVRGELPEDHSVSLARLRRIQVDFEAPAVRLFLNAAADRIDINHGLTGIKGRSPSDRNCILDKTCELLRAYVELNHASMIARPPRLVGGATKWWLVLNSHKRGDLLWIEYGPPGAAGRAGS